MKDFKTTILTSVWDVKFIPLSSDILAGNWGICIYNKNTIYIGKDLSKQELYITVYHELTHAALKEAGFNDKISSALDSYYEVFIDQFSKSISTMYKIKDLKW